MAGATLHLQQLPARDSQCPRVPTKPLTCDDEHWLPQKARHSFSLPSAEIPTLHKLHFLLQRQGSHRVPRHANIAKTSISKPLSQGLLCFSNGFTVTDRLNSLSFMATLQDILFLPWNKKISSLDECFKKEAVTANKSDRSVLSPVNI